MFGWVVAGGVTLVGLFALNEAAKPTAKKVRNGDSVNVPSNALAVSGLGANTPAASAQLGAFLAGTIKTTVTVTAVQLDAKAPTLGSGTIIGFPLRVEFPLTSVQSIDRNGARIT